MTRIFIRLTFILALVILADKICYFAFSAIFKQTISGQSGGTINYVIKHKNDIDFIILGSSRAKNGINPDSLSSLGKGYNLGINGSKPLNSLLVLDVLLSKGVRPKTIILQADLFELGKDNEEDTIEQLKRAYPYDTPLIREYVKDAGIAEEFKYSFGLYRFNRKLLNIGYNFLKKDSIGKDNGFVGLPSSPEKLDLTPMYRGYEYEKDGLNARALIRIKELADAYNVPLVIVFPPTYRNVGYNPSEQKRLIESLKENRFPSIVDFSNVEQLPELAHEEEWRDSFHLSESGARYFSQMLSQTLKIK